MSESLQTLMAVQGLLTAISGGFNALYFAGYSTSHPARKVATLVLSLVNLSFLLQGLYWVLLESQASQERIPFGAPARPAPDISNLSPQEKILVGLSRK